MNSRLVNYLITIFFSIVIVTLSVCLVIWTENGVTQYQESKKLKQKISTLSQDLRKLKVKQRELAEAKEFMIKASEFVTKAERLGISSGRTSLYNIDFSQAVSLVKIPLMLEQSQSNNGRYFVPEYLMISRLGIVGDDLVTKLSSAIAQRQSGYQLSFKGDVFVVNHEG